MPRFFEHLDDITTPYDHIYISPHIDDAALSCGGAIARHVAQNQQVLVVTLCTAAPPSDSSLSPFAQELHQRWGLPPDQAVQARLHEDVEALECLGVDGYWACFLDAIYRQPTAYHSNETLFGTVAPDDTWATELTALLQDLARRFPNAMFYAPLGVGNHVDHQITYAAALNLAREGSAVAFYEDFPYVYEQGVLEQRLVALGGVASFVPSILDIDATLARKISAIEAYASQIGTLFGDGQHMAYVVTTYAETLRPDVGTHGERLWLHRL